MEKKFGLTLVEILVAVVILALAIGGIFMAFKSGERYSVEDKQKDQAINVSRQVLEQLKGLAATDFTDPKLTDTGSSSRDAVTVGLISDSEDPLSEYRESCTYTVEDSTETAPSGGPKYKKIEVTYKWKFWKKEDAEPTSISLSTIVANPALGPAEVSEVIP